MGISVIVNSHLACKLPCSSGNVLLRSPSVHLDIRIYLTHLVCWRFLFVEITACWKWWQLGDNPRFVVPRCWEARLKYCLIWVGCRLTEVLIFTWFLVTGISKDSRQVVVFCLHREFKLFPSIFGQVGCNSEILVRINFHVFLIATLGWLNAHCCLMYAASINFLRRPVLSF